MASEDQPETGTSGETKFLNSYDDSNKYAEHVLRSVLQATKAANDLPEAGEDFEYFSSFASFRQVMQADGKSVLKLMSSLASQQVGKGKFEGLDLEEKFDLLADINDTILERVGNSLDEADGVKKKQDDVVLMTVSATNRPIHTSWNLRDPKLAAKVHLLAAKNVVRPQINFRDKVDNRNIPFVPIIRDKPHSLKPLALLPERTADGQESYGHPYEWEIDRFEPPQEHLKPPAEKKLPAPLEQTAYTLVETSQQLQDMCAALSKETEIAVDLEHHSYRSFQGITCLMQISTRSHDYIVDTLKLRHELQVLNEVFANPKIIKVLHGADMDVLWLQRDFGLYLVGLFDTGQAARVLGLAHFSLAFLLRHYCRIEADKQFQLADWRIRPLPAVMIHYARSDTHYLLYIMDCLKSDLADRSNNNDNLVRSVFDRSKQVALKRYEKPIYNEQSYLELYRKSRKTFNSRQLHALRHLYAWRDHIARVEDESTGYVLPKHMILEISEVLPREQQGIVACCNPCPPLVRQNLNELHSIILKAREVPLNQKTMVPEELSWPVAAQVDLDSVLHSVHDRPRHDDAHLSLPTLLDEDGERVSAEKRTSRLVTKAVPSLGALAAKIPRAQSRANSLVLPYKRYKAAAEQGASEGEEDSRTPAGNHLELRAAEEEASSNEATALKEEKQQQEEEEEKQQEEEEEEEQEEEEKALPAVPYEDTALNEPLRSPKKTRRGKRKKPEPDVGLLPDGQTYNSPHVSTPSSEIVEDGSEGGTSFQPFDYNNAQTPKANAQKKQPWSYNPEKPADVKSGRRKRRRQQVKSHTFGNQDGSPAAKWPKR
ncbi:exosome component Rrp6 [Amblyomma americanum]